MKDGSEHIVTGRMILENKAVEITGGKSPVLQSSGSGNGCS
jgi:hypothetical protein